VFIVDFLPAVKQRVLSAPFTVLRQEDGGLSLDDASFLTVSTRGRRLFAHSDT